MKQAILIFTAFAVAFAGGFYFNNYISHRGVKSDAEQELYQISQLDKTSEMKLGAFSISLTVKDLQVSKQFYENLGFTVLGGSMEENYLIMKNENALIGLFQGMFEKNILTFNPGWNENGKNIDVFDDVRDIQQELKDKGVKFEMTADEQTTGPASFIINDPDGNPILVDQHR